MSGRYGKGYGKKARKVPITELAIKQLTAPNRETRRQSFATMRRTYGRKATNRALLNASQVLEICDPNFRPPL